MKRKSLRRSILGGIVVASVLISTAATAGTEENADGWQFVARIYGWVPSIDGSLRYDAAGPGASLGGAVDGSSVTVDAGDKLNALNMAFMGTFLVRKGDWSLITDLIYVDLSDDKNNALRLPHELGPGINVNTDLSLTAWVWKLAGGYRVYQTDPVSLNLILGARMLSIDTEADLRIQGPLRSDPPGRKLSKSATLWDGIVGVEGRIELSDSWFMPYYLDIGTGDSSLTWLAMTGVGRAFNWGDLTLTYRHLSYDQSGDKLVQDLSLSGPELGVVFRF